MPIQLVEATSDDRRIEQIEEWRGEARIPVDRTVALASTIETLANSWDAHGGDEQKVFMGDLKVLAPLMKEIAVHVQSEMEELYRIIREE